jgi:ribosomal-protein-alanine N-acetyltransferase
LQLAALHSACFSPGWGEKDFQGLLKELHYGGFLLEGRVSQKIGLIDWYQIGDTGEIYSLCVLPPYRKRGLGRQLLSALLETAPKQGIHTLFLEVAEENTAARRLYETSGFYEVGRRSRYYPSAHEHGTTAIVLSQHFCENEQGDM